MIRKKEANILLNELAQYSESLADKPKLLSISKNDLVPEDMPVTLPEGWLSISSITGKGLDQAVRKLADMVNEARRNEITSLPL